MTDSPASRAFLRHRRSRRLRRGAVVGAVTASLGLTAACGAVVQAIGSGASGPSGPAAGASSGGTTSPSGTTSLGAGGGSSTHAVSSGS